MNAFDLNTANPEQLKGRLAELQAEMVSLDTTAEQLAENQKEMMAVIAKIRSFQQDRVTKLETVIADVKLFGFTPKEIFGDIVFTATATGKTKTEPKRPPLTEDKMTNLVTVGAYDFDGTTVEIKIGDYTDQTGKTSKRLLTPAREFKQQIKAAGVDGFKKAISNEVSLAFLKEHTVASRGQTVGELSFPNIQPILTYTKFDKAEFEKALGIDKLRKEHDKTKAKA